MSSCDGWAPQSGAATDTCNLPAAALCWLMGIYTLTKVPFYLFARPLPHGLEVCVLLGCAHPLAVNTHPSPGRGARHALCLRLRLSTPAPVGWKTEPHCAAAPLPQAEHRLPRPEALRRPRAVPRAPRDDVLGDVPRAGGVRCRQVCHQTQQRQQQRQLAQGSLRPRTNRERNPRKEP